MRGASASAAQICTQHRVALDLREGEIAMDKVLSNRHPIANACTAPASSCTDGSHIVADDDGDPPYSKARENLERNDI